MKTHQLLTSLALLTLASSLVAAAPLGTAFTFQGKLTDGGPSANGVYDLKLTLFDTNSGGSAVAGPITNSPVGVTNGLFTTTLDFGVSVFSGEARWLEVGLRTNGGGVFATFPTRQLLTPAPYALWAQTAATALTLSGPLQADRLNIGVSHTLAGQWSSIAGGSGNTVMGNFSFVGGGQDHTIQTGADYSTIGGGLDNQIQTNASHATIGGGGLNIIHTNALGATIGGGNANSIDAFGGTIGGGQVNEIRTSAEFATLCGGKKNSIKSGAGFATIVGGAENVIGDDSRFAMVAGGYGNRIGTESSGSTISGGDWNQIQIHSESSTISGGSCNTITNVFWGVLGGGTSNTIQGYSRWVTIAGGALNTIQENSHACTIGGGGLNTVATPFGGDTWGATIPGGMHNLVYGDYSFAAGYRAKAYHRGAFVWADSTQDNFESTRSDEFNIRAAGGVRIESPLGIRLNAADKPLITRDWDPFTSGANTGLGRWGLFMETLNLVIGVPSLSGRQFQVARYNEDGSRTELMRVDQIGNLYTLGAVNPPSDRAVKQDFAPVNPQAVLEGVARLPLQTWAYTNHSSVRHLGPTAQDFHAAFRVGADDKHIATVDADGVALAAIQGLNQRLEETRAELKRRDAENAELRQRLDRVELLLHQQRKGSE